MESVYVLGMNVTVNELRKLDPRVAQRSGSQKGAEPLCESEVQHFNLILLLLRDINYIKPHSGFMKRYYYALSKSKCHGNVLHLLHPPWWSTTGTDGADRETTLNTIVTSVVR